MAEHRDFDPWSAALQDYDDQAYMSVYYVAESLADAMEKFRFAHIQGRAEERALGCVNAPKDSDSRALFPNRLWVAQNMERRTQLRYNPQTQAIVLVE